MRRNLKKFFAAAGGCGCGTKQTACFEPQPKSASPAADGGIPPQLLPEDHDRADTHKSSRAIAPCPEILDTVAEVKHSDDPYGDFRQSMLQMIVEKEIYSPDGLRQLLQCFLELNSQRYHKVILQAFMEIWNGAGEDGGEGHLTTM